MLPKGGSLLRLPLVRGPQGLLFENCCQSQNERRIKMKPSLWSHFDFSPKPRRPAWSCALFIIFGTKWPLVVYRNKCIKKQICHDLWGFVLLCFGFILLFKYKKKAVSLSVWGRQHLRNECASPPGLWRVGLPGGWRGRCLGRPLYHVGRGGGTLWATHSPSPWASVSPSVRAG